MTLIKNDKSHRIIGRGLTVCAAYYGGAFLASYLIMRVSGGSQSRVAYGMICAWWAALYVSNVLEIKPKELLPLAIIGFPIAAFLASKRHDDGYSVYGNIVLFLLLMTPALINVLVGILKVRLRALYRLKGE